jgi:hypothetical protein
MRGLAPKTIFYLTLFLCLVFTKGQAAAAQCSDIYPGAEIGPPPEWRFWRDGSACFVRWVSQDAEHEERLSSRCRETVGARFVHFERDRGVGHSICIFKALDDDGPVQDAQRSQNKLSNLSRSQQHKSDLENQLSEMAALVTRWNEDCLKKERTKELAAAGLCWKAAANAVEDLNGSAAGLLIPAIDRELEELRLTWLKRATQLESSLAGTKEAVVTIQPAASFPDSPDPNRLAATAACSSTNLGDYKSCIGSAIGIGDNQFTFKLKPGCFTASIAAISTIDAQGRCVRQVISLSPDNKLVTVESYREPSVLDAIANREGSYECYARRHENISCNGKIDYSALQFTTEPAVAKKLLPKHGSVKKFEVSPQKQASRDQGMQESGSGGGTMKKLNCYIFGKSCRKAAN